MWACAFPTAAIEFLGFDLRLLESYAHDRILIVSRTIADLDASENIESKHLSEAIQ
jgi:predicted ATPase with chaperone activity